MKTICRKSASIRLRTDLIDKLKEKAMASNRSFNNLVESILMSAVAVNDKNLYYPYSDNIPNEETAKAIRESMQGIGVSDVDTSSREAMLQSLGFYEKD